MFLVSLFATVVQARFLYVGAANANNVTAFRIDPFSGALSFVGTQTAGTLVTSVALSPDNRFLYATNQNSNNISEFAIDQSSGALTSIGTLSLPGTAPQKIVIHPSGRYAFSVNFSTSNITILSVDQSGHLSRLARGAREVALRVYGWILRVISFTSVMRPEP